jgi:HEPN domain-containing protein
LPTTPTFDPTAAVDAANGFRKSALLLDESAHNERQNFHKTTLTVDLVKANLALVISATVLHALSVELILKARIFLETGKAVKGHELDKLFTKLPADAQQRAQKVYESSPFYWSLRPKIEEALTHHAATFVEYRYPHEQTQPDGISPAELDSAFLALAEGL